MRKESENPWKTLQVKEVYSNPWIRVTHEDVITPGNTEGIYGKVHFKNVAVGVIPLDDSYNTWIVGQYRYTLEEYSWEIPEGGSPMNDSPLASAKRELLEETGIKAIKWTEVIELTTSNSVTDERAYCYVAQNLSFGVSSPEDTEELRLRKLPFSKLVEMTMRGEITDAMSVATIYKVKILIDKGEL
ncbi:MAG: ADP-ribose pyrophosphatase [Maribacter sp.]|jgi:ADP-ribose pyrophosphatase